jgi:hypothetical protein
VARHRGKSHRSHRRRIRHHKRGATGVGGKIGGFLKRIFLKPVSHVVAPLIGFAAVLQLFTPLANGDGFWARLNTIIASEGKNPLGSDGTNNIFTIIGPQLIQNALPAAFTGVLAAITYKIGRWLGV